MVSCEICQDSCVEENSQNNNNSKNNSKIISAFAALDNKTITNEQGSDEASVRKAVNLPQTLTATVDGKSQTISGITWKLDKPYQRKDEEQTITFTAQLPGGYSLKSGVKLPTISVTVKAKIKEVSAFAPLPENIPVPNGDEASVLKAANLPTELTATVDGKENQTIGGIEWDYPPYEQKDKEQTITFTAKLPGGYELADGVSLPQIKVTVYTKGAALEITSFAELDNKTQNITNEKGSDEASVRKAVNLPKTLTATIGGTKQTIGGIEWELDNPPYKPSDDAQTITFTAKLPDGYELADGVSLPTISVTVKGKITIPDGEYWPFTIKNNIVIACAPNATGDEENPLTIPDGVTGIASEAFNACGMIGSVVIPDSVTSIGKEAFKNCYGLGSITIPFVGASKDGTENTHFGYIFGANNDEENKSYVPEYLKNVVITGGTTIGNFAFDDCANIYSIEIPNSVTKIGNGAFDGCTNLSSVEIPDNVTSIGYAAFRSCENLEMIEIPDGVNSIESGTFYGCSKLTSVDIPTSVKIIGEEAFYECTSLSEITIPDSITSIERCAFYKSGLTSVTIPGSVKKIGEWAFKLCSNLKAVTIQDGVETIGEESFSGCANLTDVKIPGSVENLGNSAFAYCSKLTSVTIEEGVKSIGDGTFSSCKSLAEIKFPNTLTSIGDGAFNSCKGLSKITIPASVTSIKENAFYLAIDNVSGDDDPKVSVYYEGTLAQWNAIEEMDSNLLKAKHIYVQGIDLKNLNEPDFTGVTTTIEAQNIPNRNITSVTTIPDTVTSIGNEAFKNCKWLKTVVIPDGVESIGSFAFVGCDDLTSIEIPDSVKTIGKGAFHLCTNLTEIKIPKGVTEIAGSMFYQCYKLESVTIPNSVTEIGDAAFRGCSNLTSVEIPDSITSINFETFHDCYKLESVTIPNSVTKISTEAFRGCSGLTEITIPASVTKIDTEAFSGCENLLTINYGGTKEQWGQVTKVSNWHYNVPAATVNCLGDGSEADLDYTAP